MKVFNQSRSLIVASFLILMSVSQLSQAAWWNWWKAKTYTKTEHPIVLAHGFMGFDSILNLVDYWPGIVDSLEKDGATVYVTQVSPMNSSEARGEQLITQIENILAISGADKVNLIGHSQGALDARYVATVRPDLVASITSVGGPHSNGFAAAFGDTDETISDLIGVMSDLIAAISGNSNPNDVDAAIDAFSAEAIAEFNSNYSIGLPSSHCGEGASSVNINGHTVRVYSWGGTGVVTTGIDITDLLMALSSDLIGGENDGLVARCDNHLGDVIRDDYNHNHLDLTNMMFGLVPLFESSPKSIFRAHANRLKKAGL